jgi:protein TonB
MDGWVELSFNVDEKGAVENVSVTNAEPKPIFVHAAKRRLQRWKY